MRSESEVRARELLAAEFDKDEVTAAAARRLRNDNETAVEAGAIRALAAWLASQGEQLGGGLTSGGTVSSDPEMPGMLDSADLGGGATDTQGEQHAARELASIYELLGVRNASDAGSEIARLHIAARQPVGQEPTMYQVRPRSFAEGEGWREVSKRQFDDRGEFPGYPEAEWERRTLYTAQPQAPAAAVPEDMLPRPLQDLRYAIEHVMSCADGGDDFACGRPMIDALTTLGIMQKTGRGRWSVDIDVAGSVARMLSAAPAPGVE
jgi:hypothetical protein